METKTRKEKRHNNNGNDVYDETIDICDHCVCNDIGHHINQCTCSQLNKTYSEPLEKLHKFERTMKISLQAVDHATKAIKFITERHDTTKNRRVELDDQVKEASEELKILMSACNGKKVEFDQRHTSRNEELETMGDLVQFLHQQLVIQQQKLSDSVELLKSGNLN